MVMAMKKLQDGGVRLLRMEEEEHHNLDHDTNQRTEGPGEQHLQGCIAMTPETTPKGRRETTERKRSPCHTGEKPRREEETASRRWGE